MAAARVSGPVANASPATGGATVRGASGGRGRRSGIKRRRDWSAGAALALAVAAATPAFAEPAPDAIRGAGSAGTRTTEMALSLRDAVARALVGNPGLVDARMDRMLQRYDVEDARGHFRPRWSLGAGTLDYGYSQATGEEVATVSGGPGVEMRLPTGGSVQAGPQWSRTIAGPGKGGESAGLGVSISQPLARGAGWEVANAPVALSALAEEANVLSLRGVLMDVVAQVVTAYRAAMRAALQTDIERRSLEQAAASRRVVEALIATGRIARSDLTQSDADVAEREIAVVRSEAATDRAQAALAVLLGLDAGVRVRTVEPLEVLPSPADERASLDRALETHTGYRSAEIAMRRAEIARSLAEDGSRWDVSLGASASFGGAGLGDLADRLDSHGDYRVTLNVKIPFGESEARDRKRAELAARIGHMKAARGLATARRELEIQIREAVEAVRSQARRMRLAGEALELAGKTARIADRKLRRGVASAYETGRIRNDLAAAATNELNARIDYLNAVTALERLDGTVLARYGIALDEETAQASMGKGGETQGTGDTGNGRSLAAAVGSVADAAALQRAHGEVRWRTHRLTATEVVGVTEGYGPIAGFGMSEGRFIDDLDRRQLQCVLGSATAASMRAAGAAAAVGEWVRLFGRRCTVVGVLAPARQQSFLSRVTPDTAVYVPFGALLRLEVAGSVQTLVLRAAAEATPEQAADGAIAYLRARVGDVAFEVESAKWLIRQIERQGWLFSLLLGAIGGISLTVGGVGVMNLMLTSVGERRAEIGLRRAVGARRSYIRLQFVAEAVALCAVGGALGIALGIGGTWAVCSFTGLPFAVSAMPILVGFGTSSAVGVFFGFYPAQLAARVDPIVALRE